MPGERQHVRDQVLAIADGQQVETALEQREGPDQLGLLYRALKHPTQLRDLARADQEVIGPQL
ncbi:hypothetical protein D3C87_1701020 [compost metagenome]